MRLLELSHSQEPALVHKERKQLDGAPSPTLFLPTGHKDAEPVALEGTEEPLYRHCHLHRAFPQPVGANRAVVSAGRRRGQWRQWWGVAGTFPRGQIQVSGATLMLK